MDDEVETCLKAITSQFSDGHFIQIHGIAVGPKNECSYADLAIGEIYLLAKQRGPVKPNL